MVLTDDGILQHRNGTTSDDMASFVASRNVPVTEQDFSARRRGVAGRTGGESAARGDTGGADGNSGGKELSGAGGDPRVPRWCGRGRSSPAAAGAARRCDRTGLAGREFRDQWPT